MPLFLSLLIALLSFNPCVFAETLDFKTIHHDLKINLSPKDHKITVVDTVTLPENSGSTLEFSLHGSMNPTSPTPGVLVKKNGQSNHYRVIIPENKRKFTLKYSGKIYDIPKGFGREQARGFKYSSGVISQEGVYLSSASRWYPVVPDKLVTFVLNINIPYPWNAISQGKRILFQKNKNITSITWQENNPQDAIYIIAAPFIEYTRKGPKVKPYVFLRKKNPNLANKYLDATERYITMYEKLLGPYPYKKFALVENFWETGYGMPSFTLLGPRIIRFPFIIVSSYPHEILHNWWGNSVYPDYSHGNWSEGLTAYLSDFLFKEQKNRGREYRQIILQKYIDYVTRRNEFPLRNFRSRHSSSSEVIGYGKSMMFFHMLRLRLGDPDFIQGLRLFYKRFKFKSASFDDLKESFEKTSGTSLSYFFKEWLDRTGAPAIKLKKAKVTKTNKGFLLKGSLLQTQKGDPYKIQIPVVITYHNRKMADRKIINMDSKEINFSLELSKRPTRIDIDPGFDIFRKIDRNETPPALSQTLGSEKVLIILPSKAGNKMQKQYLFLAEKIGNSGPGETDIVFDNKIKKFPINQSTIILGWENLFTKNFIKKMKKYKVVHKSKTLQLEKTTIPENNHSFMLTTRSNINPDISITWIATRVSRAYRGLARKLPHYHKYSFLAFRGEEPQNILKGRWPILKSPMTMIIPGKKGIPASVKMAKVKDRKPLIEIPEVFSKKIN